MSSLKFSFYDLFPFSMLPRDMPNEIFLCESMYFFFFFFFLIGGEFYFLYRCVCFVVFFSCLVIYGVSMFFGYFWFCYNIRSLI